MFGQFNTVRIAMADDQILLRNALAEVIDRFEDCKVILQAKHGKELLEKMDHGVLPDLVILDIDMPEMDGYECARLLNKKYPEIPVLILSMYDSDLSKIRLLQSGVRGFLNKDIDPSELKDAIRITIQDGYYYSHPTAGKLMNLFKNGDTNSPLINNISLSENELKFLTLACTDQTYKEIAGIMKINPRTIENYRNALFDKLNVNSRVGLVLFAIKNGMIRIQG